MFIRAFSNFLCENHTIIANLSFISTDSSKCKSNADRMGLIAILAIFAVSILTLVYAYFKHAFSYWKLRGVPCDDEPIIPYGSVKGIGKTITISDVVQKLYDKFKNSGAKLCGAYLYARPMAILIDLDLVKKVLLNDSNNFLDKGTFLDVQLRFFRYLLHLNLVFY